VVVVLGAGVKVFQKKKKKKKKFISAFLISLFKGGVCITDANPVTLMYLQMSMPIRMYKLNSLAFYLLLNNML
jgi:intracellular sulfur oxidation DsrE/DsrF family protein